MAETLIDNKWFASDLIRTDSHLDGKILNKLEHSYDFYQFTENIRQENSGLNVKKLTSSDKENTIDNKQFDTNFFEKLTSATFDNYRKTYAEEHAKMKGYVTSIKNDFFEARIFEEGYEDETYEIAEFDIADISPEDKNLFKVGAVFYWVFGRFFVNKQVRKMSEIRFQRIAPLSTEEFDELMDKADEISSELIWD